MVEVMRNSDILKIVSEVVCYYFETDVDKITTSSKFEDIVNSRNVVIYILKRTYNFSTRDLTKLFGKSKPAIYNSIEYVERNKIYNKKFKDKLITICNKVENKYNEIKSNSIDN